MLRASLRRVIGRVIRDQGPPCTQGGWKEVEVPGPLASSAGPTLLIPQGLPHPFHTPGLPHNLKEEEVYRPEKSVVSI